MVHMVNHHYGTIIIAHAVHFNEKPIFISKAVEFFMVSVCTV